MESALGSRGTWSGGVAADPPPEDSRLVPWIHMPTTDWWDDSVGVDYLVTHIALSRAKAAKELVFFSGYNPQVGCDLFLGGPGDPTMTPAPPTVPAGASPRAKPTYPNPNDGHQWPPHEEEPFPCDHLRLARAWDIVQDAVLRVYTPRVDTYSSVWGVPGPVPPPPDPIINPARLEHTLRTRDGQDLVVLGSVPLGPDVDHYNELIVTMKDVPESAAYTINLEMDVTVATCAGRVQVFDWAASGNVGAWVDVIRPEENGGGSPFFFYWTPVDADGRYASRWSATVAQTGDRRLVKVPLTSTTRNGEMRIRIDHYEPEFAFETRYDLAQVIPLSPPVPWDSGGNEGDPPIGNAMAPIQGPQSDSDKSGAVTVEDLVLFTEGYLNGEIAADMNQDDEVNADDLAAYVGYFSDEI